ncbi:hypothetical protein JZ751_024598 [Albula glossodonta]|uniref:Uncharacterized protein n=1 Tax=Albula glossodonta TaxID=121402 RepID=A0A8T2PET2_9TELE|nr:hypothetical protein JZ751_024598 [Albula glossodonta]
MRFRAFFFLLLLTCLYLSLAQGSYENCCLKLAKRVRVSTRKAVVRSFFSLLALDHKVGGSAHPKPAFPV